MNKKNLIILTVSAILLSTYFFTTSAVAQTPNSPDSGQALEISPPVLNVTASPGKNIQAEIKLRDVANVPLIVANQINDFVAAGEDGTPKILLEDAPDNPYSLKSWIQPLPELALKPREVRNLPLIINVPANASPGGYYGVIRFTATPPNMEDTGVSLSASLGSLVLLRVKGNAKEKIEIQSFTASKNGKPGSLFTSAPIDFSARIKNTGNVHEQPVGKANITDMFGNEIATVNMNLERRNVLPSSTRQFKETLGESTIGNKILFGFYKADLEFTYGSKNQTVNEKLSFWVIPYRLITIIIASLVIGFFVLRTMLRRYNARIIARATGKSKTKK